MFYPRKRQSCVGQTHRSENRCQEQVCPPQRAGDPDKQLPNRRLTCTHSFFLYGTCSIGQAVQLVQLLPQIWMEQLWFPAARGGGEPGQAARASHPTLRSCAALAFWAHTPLALQLHWKHPELRAWRHFGMLPLEGARKLEGIHCAAGTLWTAE